MSQKRLYKESSSELSLTPMKTNKMTESLTNGEAEIKQFRPEELNDALWHALEIMERCSLQFTLLKDTADSVRNRNTVDGQEITIGVRKAEFVKDSLSTLKTLAANNDFHVGIDGFKETAFGYEWNYKGLPIRLHILKRNYEFLKNPEPVWFWGETLMVPNPFDKYYKARYIIK